jgi:putative ABC transport system permease protein
MAGDTRKSIGEGVINQTLQTIPLINLALAFIPVIGVIVLMHLWSREGREAAYGMSRMLGQLLIIGYFLTWLFASDNPLIIVVVLIVMVVASSWIALRTVRAHRKQQFLSALIAVSLGGAINLVIVTEGVLGLEPWYQPRMMIPLAGMIFASSMNSVSIAAERLVAELQNSLPWDDARNLALKAAMIPVVNGLFAVGLVTLPGTMTGQILSGVDPLIAARYQIMVMCMLFGAAGLSAAIYLTLVRKQLVPEDNL